MGAASENANRKSAQRTLLPLLFIAPPRPWAARLAVRAREKEILETLKRYDGKKVEVQGKLRVDNKYLIVSQVAEPPAPPQAPGRRAGGGI